MTEGPIAVTEGQVAVTGGPVAMAGAPVAATEGEDGDDRADSHPFRNASIKR